MSTATDRDLTGLRVKIVSLNHGCVGKIGRVRNRVDGQRFYWAIDFEDKGLGSTEIRDDCFDVIDEEPTIGQLYDQMDSLVFEACDRLMIDKPCVDIRIFGDELTFVDIKWFRGGEPTGPEYTKGKTPQEAIRAMIDRLKDMLGHTTP